jgi:hypothetical protein
MMFYLSLKVESENAQQSGDLELSREFKTKAEGLKLQTFIDIHLNDLLLNAELFNETSNPKN